MKPIWQYTTGAGRDSSQSRHVARPDSPAAICGYRPSNWSGLAEDKDPHQCRNCLRALKNKKYMTRLFGSAFGEAQAPARSDLKVVVASVIKDLRRAEREADEVKLRDLAGDVAATLSAALGEAQ